MKTSHIPVLAAIFIFILISVAVLAASSIVQGSGSEPEVPEATNVGSFELENARVTVTRFEDEEYDAVCWVMTGDRRGGITCLPKDQFSDK